MRWIWATFAVIAFDALTKAVLATPQWAWHSREWEWKLSAVVALAIPLLMLLIPRFEVAASLIFAGIGGNLLTSLTGPIANPFQVGNYAFNAADAALVMGSAAAVTAMFMLAIELWKGGYVSNWRYYEIGPYGAGYSRPFYAPSLSEAFHQARLHWGSRSLTCYRSKPNNHKEAA